MDADLRPIAEGEPVAGHHVVVYAETHGVTVIVYPVKGGKVDLHRASFSGRLLPPAARGRGRLLGWRWGWRCGVWSGWWTALVEQWVGEQIDGASKGVEVSCG